MNRPLRATLEAGQATGRFDLVSIDCALICVLGIVSTAIRFLIQSPPIDPPARIAVFVSHILASVNLTAQDQSLAIAERAVNLVLAADSPDILDTELARAAQ